MKFSDPPVPLLIYLGIFSLLMTYLPKVGVGFLIVSTLYWIGLNVYQFFKRL